MPRIRFLKVKGADNPTPTQTLERHAAYAIHLAEENGSAEDLRKAKLIMGTWRPSSLDRLRRDERPPTWLIYDWWLAEAYGMTVGAEKTLKSWINLCEAFSIASGYPLFGQFTPHTVGPVLIFTGEGGADLTWKRLRHIARAFSLDEDALVSLPIRVVDDIGTTDSAAFQATLEIDLGMRHPALVVIDPLYAYVGGDAEQGNVFDMGDRLHQLSAATVAGKVALKIGHHARKLAPGQHPTLSDITQAGSREWVAAWQLISHREPPNLDAQEFKLRITIGSRMGHGAVWDLDLRLGPFNSDSLEHEDQMTWTLKAAAETEAEVKADKVSFKLQTYLLQLRKLESATVSDYATKYGVEPRTAERHLKALVTAGKARCDEHKRYYPTSPDIDDVSV